METKNGIAFWYNLKGRYDVVVFDNKKNLNKFYKEFAETYNKMQQEEISCEEFEFLAEMLSQRFEGNIVAVINEISMKDIDKGITFYDDGIETRVQVCQYLEYGI